MALVEREVDLAQEGDVAVGRIRDTVYNPETGIMTERETIAVEIPTENGETAHLIAQEVRVTRVPEWIRNTVHQQNVHRPPQFTTREWWNGSNRNQEQPSDDCEDILGVYNFCCILCFLPCIFNNICLAGLQCFIFILVLLLAIFTGLGPASCPNPLFTSSTIVSFILFSIIILMLGVCLCVAWLKNEDQAAIRTWCFFIAGFLGFTFVLLTVINSGLASNDTSDYNDIDYDIDCQFTGVVHATVAFSYILIGFFCYSWSVCFYLLSEST